MSIRNEKGCIISMCGIGDRTLREWKERGINQDYHVKIQFDNGRIENIKCKHLKLADEPYIDVEKWDTSQETIYVIGAESKKRLDELVINLKCEVYGKTVYDDIWRQSILNPPTAPLPSVPNEIVYDEVNDWRLCAI